MELGKYSIGVGDRFGMEGIAQLRALNQAEPFGTHITPVWNKSNREHTIIGTSPQDTRRSSDAAVRESGWRHAYYLDADHIGLATVDRFIEPCDFFTIDVADYIGKKADPDVAAAFVKAMTPFAGALNAAHVHAGTSAVESVVTEVASKYLFAIEEAGKVYQHIVKRKGEGKFITEVSFDEADAPQTPAELFFILGGLARQGIPLQTVAPKFTGAFLKGVDYIGDVAKFAREFEDDLAVVSAAVAAFGLPGTLKLSIHSGSDKFSIYPAIHAAIRRHDAGIHLKTAGTTWLEEVIGLASTGDKGLRLAQDIYAQAFDRYEELCKPYLQVVEIDRKQLPSPRDVRGWSAAEFVAALEHDQHCPRFNRHFRQLMHVAFKVAAEPGNAFTEMLQTCRGPIESKVTSNIFDRHVRPLFLGR